MSKNSEFAKTLNMPADYAKQAAAFADAKGLSLAAREVVAQFKDGWTGKDGKYREPTLMLVVTAESLMAMALRERKFAPIRTQFTIDGSTWTDVWLETKPPAACRVTFEVADIESHIVIVHTWAEYTQGKATHAQLKMPATMLAKATRSLGIRQIAPSATSGMLSEEEASAVEGAIDGEVEEIRETNKVLTPDADKEAKGAAAPRSEQFNARKDELVKIGKQLRADLGDDAAKEFAIALNDRGCDFDKLTAGDMVFIKSQAELIEKKAEAAKAADAAADAGVANAIDEFDAEIII